jgi:hypothetical protein
MGKKSTELFTTASVTNWASNKPTPVPGAFDPGTIQTFTKQDQAEVDRRLRQVLHSFRFLK